MIIFLFQLESWFKGSSKKSGIASRPGSQSMSRPTSETDFGDLDEELKIYEHQIETSDEKEINKRFEDLLVSLNLEDSKM